MKKFATIQAEFTDKGTTIKMEGYEPAIIALLGQVIVGAMERLDGIDKMALQSVCSNVANDKEDGLQFIKEEFPAQITDLLKRKGGF